MENFNVNSKRFLITKKGFIEIFEEPSLELQKKYNPYYGKFYEFIEQYLYRLYFHVKRRRKNK